MVLLKMGKNRKTKNIWLQFFLAIFFGNDGFQNIFVYQPTLNRLELEENKGTE